jgi:hypothetical protein
MAIDIDDPSTWPVEAAPEPAPAPRADLEIPEKKKKRVSLTIADGRIITTSDAPQVVVDGTIDVASVTRTERGLIIRCRIRRAWDGEVAVADLIPKTMEFAQHWNEWLGQKAGVNGRINPQTRQLLKDYIFEQAEAVPESIGVERTGYLNDLDVLAFENGWIGADGVSHVATPGVPANVRIGGSRGPATRLLVNIQSPSPDAPQMGFPVDTAMTIPRAEDAKDARAAAQFDARGVIRSLLDLAHKNYGNHVVQVALGYMFAHAVSPYLFKHHHRFPHLYVTGPYQTGKDWLARIAWTVAGGKDGAATSAGGGSTPKGIRNRLAASSLLPLHVNELRGLKDEEYLAKFIRAGYDRQGSTITNTDQQDVSWPVNRSFMLVGERVVGGGAELSRYVTLETREVKRPELGDKVMALAKQARAAWTTLLCDWHLAAPRIDAMIAQARVMLAGCGLDDRRAFGWSCVIAAAAWIREPTEENPAQTLGEEFMDECIKRALASSSAADEASITGGFWDSAALLVQQTRVSGTGNMRFIRVTGPAELSLDVARVSGYLKDMARTSEESISLVKNELRRVNAFLGTGRRLVQLGAAPRTCFVFNVRDRSVGQAVPDWALRMACTSDMGIFDDEIYQSIQHSWTSQQQRETE